MHLSKICKVLNSPITEEQAWAISYQCLKSLHAQIGSCTSAGNRVGIECGDISTDSIYLSEYGYVTLSATAKATEGLSFKTESEIVYYVATSIYQSLDYGINDNEERQLGAGLEHLIQEMVADILDEGITNDGDGRSQIRLILKLCSAHLQNGVNPEIYYRDIVSQMVSEVRHMESIIAKVSNSCKECEWQKKNLPSPQVTTAWYHVMEEIRMPRRRLEKVDKKCLEHIGRTQTETTPHKTLMADIRAQRFKLKSIMVDGEPPQQTRKDIHSFTMQLIRSMPTLKPVNERPLNPSPPRTFTLREQLLREVRNSFPQLRHVFSPKILWSANSRCGKSKRTEDDHTSCSLRRLNPDKALTESVTSWLDEDDTFDSDHFSSPDETSPQDQAISLQHIVHIRSVLIKGRLNEAEFGANQTFFLELQDGKICFCCQKRRFNPFGNESETCNLCGQKVCSDCLIKKVSDSKKRSCIENPSTPFGPPVKKAKKACVRRLNSWSSLPMLLPMITPGKKSPEVPKETSNMKKQRLKTPKRLTSWKSLPAMVTHLTLSGRQKRLNKRHTASESRNFSLRPEDIELCTRLDMCRDCTTLVEKASVM